LIPAERDGGMTHEVAKFSSVKESITSYMNNLNTNAAYAELRNVRKLLRDAGVDVTAQDLIPELTRYSERKDAYVAELMQMLVQNQEYL
jgi:Bax protein